MNNLRRFPPPLDESFAEGEDFIESPALAGLASSVIDRFLPDMNDGVLEIYFAWKRNGGSSAGNSILGKCTKLTGLTKHFAGSVHFAIWLAADHCIDFDFDDTQIEALVFHELCHIQVEEPGTYTLRGHDCELFISELERYGAWRPGLQAVVDASRQVTERTQRKV